MRIFLIIGWLFAGLGAAIYHYGPGQERLEMDDISRTLEDAGEKAAGCQWSEAIELYDQVLADLPDDDSDRVHRVMLEKCKAQMMAAELPAARESLATLLDDMRSAPDADPQLVAEVQSSLANSQYYMTWLMRLEGMPETEWMPEIEAARQHYTLLAVSARDRGDSELELRSSEDLEAAIRLARMDLSELQGLPLPSQ